MTVSCDEAGVPSSSLHTVTVLLADDHGLVRTAFRRILEDSPEIRVIGEAADGLEAVRLALELRPQVVIMDLSMPRLNGLLATTRILEAQPGIAILIVSMYSGEHQMRSAIAAGARGYILKNALDADLAGAVKRVAADEIVVPPEILQPPTEPDEEPVRLTPRQAQILQLIADGKSNKEIATILDLSVNTINVHRAHLMGVLRVRRTAELVSYAVRKGLVHIR